MARVDRDAGARLGAHRVARAQRIAHRAWHVLGRRSAHGATASRLRGRCNSRGASRNEHCRSSRGRAHAHRPPRWSRRARQRHGWQPRSLEPLSAVRRGSHGVDDCVSDRLLERACPRPGPSRGGASRSRATGGDRPGGAPTARPPQTGLTHPSSARPSQARDLPTWSHRSLHGIHRSRGEFSHAPRFPAVDFHRSRGSASHRRNIEYPS